MVINRLTTGPM